MMLGNALLYSGQTAAAIPEFQSAIELAPSVATLKGLLAVAYSRAGRNDDARALLDELGADTLAAGNAVAIARTYVALGEPDSAFHWLSRGVEQRDPFFHSEGFAAPVFDALRGDPRFASLIERLGLDVELLGR
jgi:tetratricopeptide (TPR) repeat protein